MIDFAAHKEKIQQTMQELSTCTNPKRRHDLKKYLTRLYREMAEAKKWQRGEMFAKSGES